MGRKGGGREVEGWDRQDQLKVKRRKESEKGGLTKGFVIVLVMPGSTLAGLTVDYDVG